MMHSVLILFIAAIPLKTTLGYNVGTSPNISVINRRPLPAIPIEQNDENKNGRSNDQSKSVPSTSKIPPTSIQAEPIYEDIYDYGDDWQESEFRPLSTNSTFTGSPYGSIAGSVNDDYMNITLKDYLRAKKRGIGRTYQRHVGSKVTNIKDKASNAVGNAKHAIGDRIFKTKYAIGNTAYNAKAAVLNVATKAKNNVSGAARKAVHVATAPSRKVKKIYNSFKTYPKDNIVLKSYERDDIKDE
ncbi:hypothetical protein BMR1_02g01120 [Babesia microti strain RI]|uniref:Uncharacterized protein n=1 Tax=Babesia microti (strain RI) TaxID=1133968 RepID=A0A1R4AA59_BABMR|nr:hypothetical protein BMR1_02g01120 [Babesia microti strain RI]SJK85874.1 hypothetical protein BMR1_02g01120 [Babesia microti strain RI]|eukprot:XP_021338085.1 hypothetical protein BMR1_02g01120 [Babesia microti strain RI]